MIIATGTHSKHNGIYRMHSPYFPYSSIIYSGYSRREMVKQYRNEFNLKYKRINFIILEVD